MAKQNQRILIVGGVAGGASAAARARRMSEDAEIVIFERGEHISFANCGLPYHIGGVIVERGKLLVQTPAAMKKRFNIDVRTRTEVVRIDPAARQIIVRDLATGAETAERYDALILSPGADPIRPGIPGADIPRVFTLRSMADMDAIKGFVDVQEPARAVVIGGGYIGLEMTEALRARGVEVTLVELANQVFNPADPEMAAPLHQELRFHGVDLRLGQSVTQIVEQGDGLAVRLSGGEGIACGMAIMAIGVRPDVKLAREAGLTIGPTGGIAVDEHMRTSDAHIFAVGDAVEVADFVTGRPALFPLAGPANRQGRIAADNALGRASVYRKTQGTAICKVFDLAIGMTGLSEKAARRAGLACEKVYVHPASHASYYPGASPISLKLLFDPNGGKVLGAQAVGSAGIDKRIDVLAVAIRAGLTVFDLEDMELSYAPPYGSAKDPINYAGFVAANVLRGDVKLCHTPDMLNPQAGQALLDVRMPAELQAGAIPGAINVPLDDLRGRLAELPRDKELLVFCAVGLRGYLACRILQQKGFACRNLTGGYKTFKAATEAGSGVACSGAVRPLGPEGAACSGAVRPLGPEGAACSGAVRPLGPEGAACSAAVRPLGPEGAEDGSRRRQPPVSGDMNNKSPEGAKELKNMPDCQSGCGCESSSVVSSRPDSTCSPATARVSMAPTKEGLTAPLRTEGLTAPLRTEGLTAPLRTEGLTAPLQAAAAISKRVDATGLACPGPIMRLKTELEGLAAGQVLAISASDPGFMQDVGAWCHSTGNQLLDVKKIDGRIEAVVRKQAAAAQAAAQPAPCCEVLGKSKSIIVFSGDFDKAMAAFIIANGAAAMGSKVTMFFTFWGLNVLRKPAAVPVKKNLIAAMFGWMMPRGADKLGLSRMNMGGMGLAMIKGIMRKKNVASLPDLIQSARAAGVRLVACTMSMDLMGIQREELLDGVEEGGVAMYLDSAEAGNVNLFI